MPQHTFRIVLDTNTLLRGLVARSSASARIRQAAERRIVVPLLSKPVIDEYRDVLSDEGLVERFPEITAGLAELTIRRLRFIGDYIRSPRSSFEYSRDPADQKFIELAIALDATHILTFDNDLLSLPGSRTEAGKRFRQRLPKVKVMSAPEFQDEHAELLHGAE